MIVNRRSFNVIAGQGQAAIELLKAEAETMDWPHGLRVYTSNIGRLGIVAFEAEYDNLAQYEKFWDEWSARSTTLTFLEKWRMLANPDALNEIWTIEKFK